MNASFTIATDVRSIASDMFATVEYPQPLRARVDEMICAWRAFCALPIALKQQFGYTADTSFSGSGYELKLDKATGFDLKENFHVGRDKRVFLYGEAARIGAPEMKAFLDAAMAVYEELDPQILRVAEAIEETYQVSGLAKDVELMLECLIIRLLHYFESGDEHAVLGDPHCDKGVFTGHLYESHPGVERLTKEGQWVPMDVSLGSAVFFPGMTLQNRAKCRIYAPCHRIVANEDTARKGRWSSVCFTNAANTRHYDKGRVGRAQGLPPGFNYLTTSEEFDKLFADQLH